VNPFIEINKSKKLPKKSPSTQHQTNTSPTNPHHTIGKNNLIAQKSKQKISFIQQTTQQPPMIQTKQNTMPTLIHTNYRIGNLIT
jgi:hypothetical protein